eukprot:TRINITY_DN58371_c0_g1_i1.p1 TRINITY_DN58371_c0_g1~~TRINITY_DN58371_c0_g1_i1.p1  ORF type:complete len:222 (-),score=44.78 TRINITY_DN58371_c0_g1_i1:70-735(-)
MEQATDNWFFKVEAGCISDNFETGDSEEDRQRLDEGMAEVMQLMQREGLTFDEARLHIVRNRMALMGVDSSGMPLDPKAFTFEKVPAPAAPRPWRHNAVAGLSAGWQRGSRRCVNTEARCPLPKLLSASSLPSYESSTASSGGVQDPWSLLAASCRSMSMKPLLRGWPNPMLVRAILLLCLALTIVLLRLFWWQAESIPPLLVQGSVRQTVMSKQDVLLAP